MPKPIGMTVPSTTSSLRKLDQQLHDARALVNSDPRACELQCRAILKSLENQVEPAAERKQDVRLRTRCKQLISNALERRDEIAAAIDMSQEALSEALSVNYIELIVQTQLSLTILNVKRDQFAQAEEHMQALAAIDPKELNANLRFLIKLKALRVKLMREDFDAMDQMLLELEKDDPLADKHELDVAARAEYAALRADHHRRRGQLEDSQKFGEQACELYLSINDDYSAGQRLLELSIGHLMRGHTQSAIDCAQRGHVIFDELGSEFHISASLMLLGICERRAANFDQAMQYFERCLDMLQDRDNPVEMGNCLNNIADIHNARGEFGQGLKRAFEALNILRSIPNLSMRQEVSLSHISLAYMQLGDYEQALHYSLESLNITRSKDHPGSESAILGLIGRIYQHIGDLQRAEEYQRQCLNSTSHFGNIPLKREALHNLGAVFVEAGRSAEAAKMFEDALQLEGDEFDPIQTAEIMRGLAQIHAAAGRRDEALQLHNNSLEIQVSCGAGDEACETQRLIGELLTPTDSAQAANYLNQALNDARSHAYRRQLPATLKAMAALHEQGGDSGKALKLYHEYMLAQQSLSEERNKQRLSNLRVLHEVEDARQKAEMLQLRNRNLESDLEARERELTSKALFISRKNDLLSKLRERLNHALQAPFREVEDHIRGVVGAIEDSMHDGDDWLQFDERLNSVHQQFLETLTTRFPQLTPTELRVCSLIKLNCSTKDIGRVMNVTMRSAQMYRYRIRKRLQLSEDENLNTFLAGLS